VLCLSWEQTSFISPNALFFLGLHFSRISPFCFVFYGNKQALLVPVLPFLYGLYLAFSILYGKFTVTTLFDYYIIFNFCYTFIIRYFTFIIEYNLNERANNFIVGSFYNFILVFKLKIIKW